jgi:hypothetical protein
MIGPGSLGVHAGEEWLYTRRLQWERSGNEDGVQSSGIPGPRACGEAVPHVRAPFGRDRGRGPGRTQHGQEPVPGHVHQPHRMGRVPCPAHPQGAALPLHLGRGGPLQPEQHDLFGLATSARILESADTPVNVPELRHPARPGPQCREEHQNRGPAGRRCLWRGCQSARFALPRLPVKQELVDARHKESRTFKSGNSQAWQPRPHRPTHR